MNSARRTPAALRRLLRGRARREDGQALIIVTLAIIVLLAFAGFSIDAGRLYVAQRQLQQAVDAATLAAAGVMPNPVNATTLANQYSAQPGSLNAHPGMDATAPAITFKCLAFGVSAGVQCDSKGLCAPPPTGLPGGIPGGCNAIQIKESAQITTSFAHMIGLSALTAVSASSTVLMRGGTPHPLDVMLVLDVTPSMNQTCTDKSGNNYDPVGITGNGKASKLDCAKEGIRSLIGGLWPCDPSTEVTVNNVLTCGSPLVPEDKVGLDVFPALNTGVSAALEDNCTWTLTGSQVGYSNSSGYTIVPLSSDYRSSDSAASLSAASPLVQASSWSSCPGTWPPGTWPGNSKYGAEAPSTGSYCNDSGQTSPGLTFIGDAIRTARTAIQTDQNSDPSRAGAKGVIIVLSDGDSNCLLAGANQCQYAVQQAQQAAVFPYNDWVFSVAYDALASGNPPPCRYDSGSANEVQTILVSATGGQFTLSLDGQTTTAFTVPPTAAAMQTALQLLTTIGAGNVTVTRNNTAPFTYTLTFGGTLAKTNVDQVTATNVSLTGGGATPITVGTTTNGYGGSSGLNGFTTMQGIASDPSKFFCLHPPTGQNCNGADANTLNQIFQEVGTNITGARVVPDGTN